MFEQNYLGLPLWVWLVIVGIVAFSCWKTTTKTTAESKESFTEATGNKIKVYNFNTTWCGWSKRFQPEWNKFSDKVKSNSSLSHVEAYDVKCDDNQNKDICEEYEVQGFPTVIIEKDGKRTHYQGERTAEAIIEHIKQN